LFNSTDKAIDISETSGNYLRILGVTFTQNTSQVLTVDDFFKERSGFVDTFTVDNVLRSPEIVYKTFQGIKESRSKYGKRSFSIDSFYIQNVDSAESLMEWLVDKTLRKRMVLRVEAFGLPHLQLGDLVTIDYEMPDGYNFTDSDKKFVVYSIDYNRGLQGPDMFLEVVEI
jgi:hypothetical protein